MDINGPYARATGTISALFLQSTVHLLKSNTGSWNRRMWQCSNAEDSTTHQFVESFHAAFGEQRIETVAATISYNHGYVLKKKKRIRLTDASGVVWFRWRLSMRTGWNVFFFFYNDCQEEWGCAIRMRVACFRSLQATDQT